MLTKIKIFLAEDESDIAGMIKFKLEREGFELLWARDGGEAVEFLKNYLPDLILLDVMMPVMDGFEVLKKIKNDSRLKDVPVIMLTAKGNIWDVDEGFSLGADDYITKPFQPSELVARIMAKLEN
jgi:two-component system, OmpR family, response regulator